HGRPHKREVRVVRHEGLGKDHDLHALGGRLVDGLAYLVQRAIGRVEVGRDLDRRRADDAGGRHHRVQVSRMKALLLRCSSTMSRTSSGLIGLMPSIKAPSPCPYKACSAKRQA